MIMIKRMVSLIIALVAASGIFACTKSQDKVLELNPFHVTNKFFETWQKEDWKALYKLSDPSFMRALRTQKLTPELSSMSDEELFVREFREARRQNPGKVLTSYRIIYITPYKKGDTMLWVYADVNGKRKKIAMTLVGTFLKIDLTRINDVPAGEGIPKQP